MDRAVTGALLPQASVHADEKIEHLVWPYLLALPVMYGIAGYVWTKKSVLSLFKEEAKTNSLWFDGLSESGRKIKEGAARWPALDVIYNFAGGQGRSALARWVDAFWLNMRNAQAVRNRLRLVNHLLRQAVLEREKKCVKILSLASGTAQGIIELVAWCKLRGVRVEVLLIDKDPTALANAKGLAERHGVSDCLTTTEGDVFRLKRLAHGFNPDIIEMLGFTDYLKDKFALGLFREIHKKLSVGGLFYTCHIHPNAEARFLRQVVNWGMLYRSREELENLMCDGGFIEPQLHTEPHGIHSIAVGEKI